jgi:hypothetical protein
MPAADREFVAKQPSERTSESRELQLLQDAFIFDLLPAGTPQQTVRKIVKVDLKRVTRIGKLLKSASRKATTAEG